MRLHYGIPEEVKEEVGVGTEVGNTTGLRTRTGK